MQAIEFSSKEIKDNTIKVPKEYTPYLKGRNKIKVIILFEDEENPDWEKLALKQFLDGYAEEDNIYDKL